MNTESVFTTKTFESISEMCSVLKIAESELLMDHIMDYHNSYVGIFFEGYPPIGLAYGGYGTKPQLQVLDQSTTILIGFDATIVAIDYTTHTQLFRSECFVLFHEYYYMKALGVIIVTCELDMYVIDTAGNRIWGVGFRDIGTDYKICGDILHITTIEGWEFDYEILTGNPVISDT